MAIPHSHMPVFFTEPPKSFMKKTSAGTKMKHFKMFWWVICSEANFS